MKDVFRIALVLLFFGIAAALPAFGQKEKKSKQGQDPVKHEQIVPQQVSTIQVSGRVRLVGNDPFVQLVISALDGEWYIESGEEHKLKDLQQKTVTVEAIETVTSIKFANGLPAGERRILKEIKIINIE